MKKKSFRLTIIMKLTEHLVFEFNHDSKNKNEAK